MTRKAISTGDSDVGASLQSKADASLPPRRGRGRPAGSKNKKRHLGLTDSEQMALEESRRLVQANLTAGQVVNRAQIKTAVTGGTFAQKAHLDRIAKLEEKEANATEKLLNTYEEYVHVCEDQLDRASPERREELERTMLPHPHDVEVDYIKREVRINGPFTTLERREWNAIKADLNSLKQRMLDLRFEVELDPDNEDLQWFYTSCLDKYLTACEYLPIRHQPAPLPVWKSGKDIDWYPRSMAA
jgi:hypothetical protein